MVQRCSSSVAGGVVRHARARLGPEVLDDHFLEVPVRLVQRSQREQRLDTFEPGLANPDQDARGERDSQFAGHANCREPHGRVLVWRSVVRAARLAQPCGRALEHDSLRDGDATQCRQLAGVHASGVRVRQKPGLLEDETGRFGQVRDCCCMPKTIQLAPSGRVAKLRLVAQREEDFLAVRRLPGARDRQHFVEREVRGLAGPRSLRERAVVTSIATEFRERHEHLARVRNDRPVRVISAGCGRPHQPGEIVAACERHRLVVVHPAIIRVHALPPR